ncbi:MAG: hypothetical protein GY896_15230 [Gammaproteobacteria bacterium]|nr:hypothetical protein [Gammaproteobacteria bacterium]
MSILGYHYDDIGAMLMANWNLSENLQSITRNQPTPGLAENNRIRDHIDAPGARPVPNPF